MAINPSRGEWKIRHGVFDEFTLRILEKLRGQEHFDDLKSPVALGKEANIFTAEGEEQVIVKIYRLENREFSKMLDYLKQDPRYVHTKRRKREIVFAWTQREYRNLLIAREAVPVPKAITHLKNVLVLEQIGHPDPAPQLKNKTPTNPKEFYQEIIDGMKRLKEKGLVHGDLSEFNILNDNDTPVFIDFSQSTPSDAPNAQELWDRDVTNIIRAAKKDGVELTEEDF